MRKILVTVLVFLLIVPFAAIKPISFAEDIPSVTGLEAYADISELPYLKNYAFTAHRSSTDPNGGNHDGLLWQGYIIPELTDKVILDTVGPGIVYRIWLTGTPPNMAAGRIKIFLDNNTQPDYDMTFSSFFSGTTPPFLSPFCMDNTVSSGGYLSMLPIAFKERIVIKADCPDFFNIGYRLLPQDTRIKTFNGSFDSDLWAEASAYISDFVNKKKGDIYGTTDIKGGERAVLSEIKGKRQIVSLKIKVPAIRINQETLAAEKALALSNGLFLEIYYNGEKNPSVNAPLGSFFGYGEAGPAIVKSMMTGFSDDGTLYCNFPMPFETGAKIILRNDTDFQADDIVYDILTKVFNGDFTETGYFKTQYSRYDAVSPSDYITALRTEGAGHLVGVVQSIRGDKSRLFLEGDEMIYIDGNKTAAVWGTGTEDFYNGGWYFSGGTFSLPWHGNPVHIYGGSYDITNCYRFFVADAISFRTEIDFRLEHGPYNNEICDQRVLTFYYHTDTPQMYLSDSFSLAEEDVLKKHNYISEGGVKARLSTSFDGMYITEDINRIINNLSGEGSYSAFKINVSSLNKGVLLRRLTNMAYEKQCAEIFVDEKKVGVWETTGSYISNYARYDEFFISEKFTKGKDKLNIKIVPLQGVSWSEAEYTAYSFGYSNKDFALWFILPAAAALTLLTFISCTAVIKYSKRKKNK